LEKLELNGKTTKGVDMAKGDCKHLTKFGQCKLEHPCIEWGDEMCIDCEDYEEEE
jgi:hypothetical protein